MQQQQSLKDWLINDASSAIKNDDDDDDADAAVVVVATTTTSNDDDDDDVLTVPQKKKTPPSQILLMDGGVSTHLENLLLGGGNDDKKKFPIRELWSSSLLLSKSGQQTILQGHKDWIKSGSNIITTVTYQCHFGVKGVDTTVSNKEMESMISTGIKLARQAAVTTDTSTETETGAAEVGAEKKKKVCVVGSSGCYGAALADGSEYKGNYGVNIKVLEEFHRKKVDAFLNNSSQQNQFQVLDGIAIETIPSLLEIEAVCNVIIESQQQRQRQRQQQQQQQQQNQTQTQTASTTNDDDGNGNNSSNHGIAYWISLACCDGSTLNDGTDFVKALDVINRKDPHSQYIHGIGINCCDSLFVDELVQKITKHIIANNICNEGPTQTQTTTTTTTRRCHHQSRSRRGIIIYPNSGEEWDATNETWKSGTGIRSNIDGDGSSSSSSSSLFTDRLQNAIKVIRDTWEKETTSTVKENNNDNNNDNSSNDQITPPPPPPPPPPPRIIIGGCCRTTPLEIQALRKWIDNNEQQ